jgi:hypothetical protein
MMTLAVEYSNFDGSTASATMVSSIQIYTAYTICLPSSDFKFVMQGGDKVSRQDVIAA